MADTASKAPAKTESTSVPVTATEPAGRQWHPMESLRKEIDRLFEDFDRGLWRTPIFKSVFDTEPPWRREWSLTSLPAVDIVEHDKDFQITAELPGMDEKDIDVTLSNGNLVIRGEKKEEKEEKQKNFYLSERHHGRFERTFRVPEGVDSDKIDARFKKGVLTITLPKTPEAQKPEKKVTVKAA